MDEETGQEGSGFSVDVCRAWEKAFFEGANGLGVRKVALRSAMVMGPGAGGVFAAFHRIVRLGLGGTMGSGRQMVSWIHIDDWLRALTWLIENKSADGAYNLCSPNPVTNREFLGIIRAEAGCFAGLPAARWMLECGAFLLRTETELLLKSRWVIPSRLRQGGFHFQYPKFSSACRQILNSQGKKSLEMR